MGKKDIITKEYMEDTEVFADVFNHIIYQGVCSAGAKSRGFA